MRTFYAIGLIIAMATGSCTAFSPNNPNADPDSGSADAAQPSPPLADAGLADASALVDASDDADTPDAGTKLIAFVSVTGYSDVTTTAAADAKCLAEAEGRVSGKFVAWLSSTTTAAPARLVSSKGPVNGPWFRRDGKRIVKTRFDLTNTALVPLENPINITAAGTTQNGSVWTGTKADGGRGKICPDLPPTSGTALESGPKWTDQNDFTAGCGNTSLLVYCFQVE
jgi:hypothetical protein